MSARFPGKLSDQTGNQSVWSWVFLFLGDEEKRHNKEPHLVVLRAYSRLLRSHFQHLSCSGRPCNVRDWIQAPHMQSVLSRVFTVSLLLQFTIIVKYIQKFLNLEDYLCIWGQSICLRLKVYLTGISKLVGSKCVSAQLKGCVRCERIEASVLGVYRSI